MAVLLGVKGSDSHRPSHMGPKGYGFQNNQLFFNLRFDDKNGLTFKGEDGT